MADPHHGSMVGEGSRLRLREVFDGLMVPPVGEELLQKEDQLVLPPLLGHGQHPVQMFQLNADVHIKQGVHFISRRSPHPSGQVGGRSPVATSECRGVRGWGSGEANQGRAYRASDKVRGKRNPSEL